MVSKLIFTNCEFTENGTGVHTDGNVDLQFSNTVFTRNGQAVSITDLSAKEAATSLGFPDADPAALAELLKRLSTVDSGNRLNAAMADPGLLSRIGQTALNGTTIGANLATIASHPQVQAFIKLLSGS